MLGFVLVLSMVARMPWLPPSQREAYGVIWPQGWDFFTSPPQGSVALAYRIDGARLTPVTEPLSASANLWGARRTGYTTILETVRIVDALPDRYWHECGVDTDGSGAALTRCLPGGPRPTVANPDVSATLCGSSALTVEVPLAWRVARHGERLRRVERVAVVDLTCER